MARAARARPAPLHRGVSDDIVIREILVRLPPKALLRCRAVCRTWRRATSGCDFLLAHHDHQSSFPIVCCHDAPRYHYIHAFDHRDTGAQLQLVTRLHDSFRIEASCDGLLILCHYGTTHISMSICNPATRQHASLGPLPNYNILGMYLHRPTGEYRLLLPKDRTRCCVFVLGSDQPVRYIGGPETVSTLHLMTTSCLVRDSLSIWYPVKHESESKLVLVFDTTTESFRHMHAPVVPTRSYILEMDDTIGICSCSYNDAVKIVDIWVLQNYESGVWNYKYRLELSVAEIKKYLGKWEDYWKNVRVVSVDGDAFLLLGLGGCLLYVDTDGKLVDSFHIDGLKLYAWKHQLKQTLVPHTFFATLQGYAVNGFPFT